MNKKIIILTFLIIVFFSVINVVLAMKNQQSDNVLEPNIAIMVQNSTNTSQYDKWTNETWPSNSEYQLNTAKSECDENKNVGNYISYSSNNITINNASKNLKCTLYFDKQN